MKILRTLAIGTLLILARSHETRAFLPHGPIEISAEIVVNDAGGSTRSLCEVSEEARRSSRRDWSISVAEVQFNPGREWEGVSREIRCQSGPGNSSTHPFLIATGSTVTRLILQMENEKVLAVEVSLSLRKLSGSGEGGEPVYQQTRMEREFFLHENGDVFLPLLVANDIEKERLGIDEVFLKVAATTGGEASGAAYGAILVTSDMEGADLLLDGGVVGKTAADSETTLRNVPVGSWDVRARDSSGHEIRKVVRVEADRTVLADLSMSRPPGRAVSYRLDPLGANAQGYEEYRREADGAVVVKIPAGEFLMGNKQTERAPLEHLVYVSEFLMDKTGVTWGQFKRFAEATGIPLPPHEPYWGIHDDHPAVYVTWDEAKAYCEWAGGRLPTEAEREKAARGTDGRKYPWGNEEPDHERGVFRRSWGYEATGAVGTHPAGISPYGLQDMGGNVWEWCSDWYDADYYAVSPYRDPKGPPSGSAHVVRGGSWDSRPTVLSCSCRSWGHPGYRDGDFGFRCAMNAP